MAIRTSKTWFRQFKSEDFIVEDIDALEDHQRRAIGGVLRSFTYFTRNTGKDQTKNLCI